MLIRKEIDSEVEVVLVHVYLTDVRDFSSVQGTLVWPNNRVTHLYHALKQHEALGDDKDFDAESEHCT